MARYWGSWTATSSTGARYRLGMDYRVSGTNVIVDDYLFESAYSIYKTITLTRTGKLSGSYSVAVSTAGGVVKLGRGGTVSGSRGSSVKIGGKATNVLHGLSPSFSLSVSIPAIAPSKPGKPSVSGATTNSYKASVKAPASNGASITQYQWDASGTTFTSSGTSVTITGRYANTQHRVRVRARNSKGWSAWSAWSNYIKTKAEPPAAPSWGSTTTHESDYIDTSWTNKATSGAPYTRLRLERQSVADTTWVTVATPGSSTSTYRDSTITSNNRYRFRVRAEGPGGNSDWVYGGWVSTNPAAPTNLKAVRQGTKIKLTWTDNAAPTDRPRTFIIEDSPDGGARTQVGTVSSATEWVYDNPDPSKTHQFWVQAEITSQQTLKSPWSNPSLVVQLQAPPNAPTITGPSGTVDSDEGTRITYEHNPVDSSSQTKRRFRHRLAGGSWITETTNTTSNEFIDLAAGSAWFEGESHGTLEVQVMTWGDHATGSPWSSTFTIDFAEQPSTSIEVPDGTWDRPKLTAAWNYFDPQNAGQAEWEATLLDSDENPVENRSGSGDDTEVTFNRTLPDGTTWTFSLRVRSGTGLWSAPEEITFTVDYPEPSQPIVSVEWLKSYGANVISVENPAPGAGEVETDYNDIYRSVDGGEWELIATGVPTNGTTADYQAPSVGSVTYYAEAWSDLPSARSSEPFEHIIEPAWDDFAYLGAGNEYSEVAVGIYDISVTPKFGRDRVTRRFDQRKWPVAYDGHGLSEELDISLKVIPLEEHDPPLATLEAWRRLALARGPHLWRDPEGRHLYGTVSDVSATPDGEGVYVINFKIERTGKP